MQVITTVYLVSWEQAQVAPFKDLKLTIIMVELPHVCSSTYFQRVNK